VKLRVMTYNIHRAIGVDRRFRLERIVKIMAHNDPDIALLQEVDDAVPRSRGLDLAKELASALGYPHFAVGHNVDLRRGRYGNATLSRYPIIRETNIDLTISSRKRRGCQHTRVRVEGNPEPPMELDVFNLHLGLSAQERAWQVGRLVRSEEFSACDRSQRVLVGGDFNDWRSLLLPTFTEILGFTCCTQRARSSALGILSYPAFSPRGALDRIYSRGPLRCLAGRSCRLRLSRVASDHLPVIVDLELG